MNRQEEVDFDVQKEVGAVLLDSQCDKGGGNVRFCACVLHEQQCGSIGSGACTGAQLQSFPMFMHTQPPIYKKFK
jgi:hypothetical protein